MRIIYILIILIFIVFGCANKSKISDDYPKVRKFSEWKSIKYHKDIQMRIGWYPYQQQDIHKTKNSTWTINKDSTISAGASPVIILKYPDSTETLWLNMDIDNALLGKLIKHSLMTEIPVKKPFGDFLVEADCAKCHPTNKMHLIER